MRLGRGSCERLVPFFKFDAGIHRVVCTTNTIESIKAPYRRSVSARGHLPSETTTIRCLYIS
ncbi:hypothetical protein F8O05_12560 [Gulosibacter chungangensis]|uniref:Uncharacterized protein n=1 Tax=Gulosibacter chungangensis TaxID=979746 RepID=A0A7J5B919_9MICO|nr:transposase [Gulosibacter chungangensis]KAB1641416.1 hypothetical protein F8O05_12560 [Gulosibacter chungangensis]